MLLSNAETSADDRQQLIDALDRALHSWITYAPYLESFRQKIRRSRPVPAEHVPEDMITMNSRFVVRHQPTGETICYTLVYPGEEAPAAGRISVLSPMGTALYGARVGDEICWFSNAGPQCASIQRLLHQPEAAVRNRQ